MAITPLNRPVSRSRGMRPPGTADSSTTESGSAIGSGRQRTASSAVKIALVAPMPSASDSTAVIAKPGLRRKDRTA
jgi:hypothetical protein